LYACERLGIGFIVVLGAPEYYHRFGFRNAELFGLENEYGASEEFMALELKTGQLPLVLSVMRLSSRIWPVLYEIARRAKLLDDASFTIWFARMANPPPVNNQAVRKTSPFFSWQ
jgi:hypothetical protein